MHIYIYIQDLQVIILTEYLDVVSVFLCASTRFAGVDYLHILDCVGV